MYAFRAGVTNVFDCPRSEAARQYKSLVQDGWIIYHTVEV